ncbi:MAG: hypothetical protein QG672_2325 [Pseudomonadota bacterium]|nr:hypothetical protein [Pseudomonadota bacterium]
MPIRPENRSRYPKNWKSEIVPRIRARSGNRCECTGQCGGAHTGPSDGTLIGRRCSRLNGMPIDAIEGQKIVLTVAHLDHQPENCADDNLLHLCQRCHNRYDAPMRRRGIAERARAQRASGDLFKCEEAT